MPTNKRKILRIQQESRQQYKIQKSKRGQEPFRWLYRYQCQRNKVGLGDQASYSSFQRVDIWSLLRCWPSRPLLVKQNQLEHPFEMGCERTSTGFSPCKSANLRSLAYCTSQSASQPSEKQNNLSLYYIILRLGISKPAPKSYFNILLIRTTKLANMCSTTRIITH